MAIICHFGIKYKVMVKFLGVNLVFGQNFDPTLAKCSAFGQVFIVVDSHIFKMFHPSRHTGQSVGESMCGYIVHGTWVCVREST